MAAIFHVHARLPSFITRVAKKANIEIGLRSDRSSSSYSYSYSYSSYYYCRCYYTLKNSVGQGLFVILIFPRSRVRVMDAFNHLSTGNAISNRCSKRKKRSRPRNMRFIVSPAFLTLLNFFSSLSLSKEWRALERNAGNSTFHSRW